MGSTGTGLTGSPPQGGGFVEVILRGLPVPEFPCSEQIDIMSSDSDTHTTRGKDLRNKSDISESAGL